MPPISVKKPAYRKPATGETFAHSSPTQGRPTLIDTFKNCCFASSFVPIDMKRIHFIDI